MYDGGCKIMGYILEMQQKGEDKWERCNDFLVPVLSYTVRGLKEGKNYTFRVKAENAAGVSEPSRNTPFIKASDAVGKEDVSSCSGISKAPNQRSPGLGLVWSTVFSSEARKIRGRCLTTTMLIPNSCMKAAHFSPFD